MMIQQNSTVNGTWYIINSKIALLIVNWRWSLENSKTMHYTVSQEWIESATSIWKLNASPRAPLIREHHSMIVPFVGHFPHIF